MDVSNEISQQPVEPSEAEKGGKSEVKIKGLNFAFNFVAILSIVFTVGFATYVYITAPVVYQEMLQDLFQKIPYVGDYVYGVVDKMKILDFDKIYNNYFLPAVLVEIGFIAIPVALSQCIILILKHRIVKKQDKFISAGFIFSMLIGFLLTSRFSLMFLEAYLPVGYEIKNIGLPIIFGLELALFAGILYYLNKMKKFNLRIGLNQKIAGKLIKIGVISTGVICCAVLGGFIYAKQMALVFRDFITIDFVLDLGPAADGLIYIDLPPKLVRISGFLGGNIPEAIKGSDILTYFGIRTIDVGAYLNNVTLPVVDRYIYEFITLPTYKVIMIIASLISVLILHVTAKNLTLLKPVLVIINVGISSFLLFFLAINFTVIMATLVCLIWIGTLIHLYVAYKAFFEKGLEKLKQGRKKSVPQLNGEDTNNDTTNNI